MGFIDRLVDMAAGTGRAKSQPRPKQTPVSARLGAKLAQNVMQIPAGVKARSTSRAAPPVSGARLISDTFQLPEDGRPRTTGVKVWDLGEDVVIKFMIAGKPPTLDGVLSLNNMKAAGMGQDELAIRLFVAMGGKHGTRINEEGLKAIRSHTNWPHIREAVNNQLPCGQNIQ